MIYKLKKSKLFGVAVIILQQVGAEEENVWKDATVLDTAFGWHYWSAPADNLINGPSFM